MAKVEGVLAKAGFRRNSQLMKKHVLDELYDSV